MIERIDVLQHGLGFYGVLDYFSLKFYEALVRQDVSACLMSPIEKEFQLKWDDLPTLFLSFAMLPLQEQNVNKLLCDTTAVPSVILLVDPPLYNFYLTQSPFMILGCDDRFSQYFLKQVHFKRTFFLPHAVDKDLDFDLKGDRPFDVVMLGSFYDYEKEKKLWKEKYPKEVVSAINDAIDVTFSDIKKSFIKAFEDALHHHIPQTQEKNLYKEQDFLEICFQIERYIKGKERVDLIKSIKHAQVHIFGDNILAGGSWENLKFGSNVHIHGPVSYLASLEVMKRSKIVLNGNIKNKEGAHERIFAGLACGALVITTDTTYMQEQFTDGKDIVLFRNQELNQFDDLVMHYLNNEEQRKQIAHAGRTNVMTHHTWDHRAKSFMEHVPSLLEQMGHKK